MTHFWRDVLLWNLPQPRVRFNQYGADLLKSLGGMEKKAVGAIASSEELAATKGAALQKGFADGATAAQDQVQREVPPVS